MFVRAYLWSSRVKYCLGNDVSGVPIGFYNYTLFADLACMCDLCACTCMYVYDLDCTLRL